MNIYSSVLDCCGVIGLYNMHLQGSRETKEQYKERLMQILSRYVQNRVRRKMVVCFLNTAQFNTKNNLIPKALKETGFKLVASTINPNSGSRIYCFILASGEGAERIDIEKVYEEL